jgi:hypothetical protein
MSARKSRRSDARGRARLCALGLAAAVGLVGSDPCGPIPGGALSGELVTEPVSDWSFVDEQRHCQVEVRPSDPYSVTTYCFGNGDSLYVPAIMGESKRWTKLAVAEPDALIRVGERIYPVHFERLTDEADRRAAAEAGYRHHHHGEEPPEDLEVDDDRWYFRVTSRPADAAG